MADTCLAVIVDGQAKKSVLLEIEYQFGQALGGILKVVDLPASEESERVEFIPFCEREIGIGLRIETELTRKVVFKEIDVAEKIDVRRRVNVVGQKQTMLERHPIAAFVALLRRLSGQCLVGLRVKSIVRNEIAVAAIVLSIFELRIESKGRSKL